MSFESVCYPATCDRDGCNSDALWTGQPAVVVGGGSGTVYSDIYCPSCDAGAWGLRQQIERRAEIPAPRGISQDERSFKITARNMAALRRRRRPITRLHQIAARVSNR